MINQLTRMKKSIYDIALIVCLTLLGILVCHNYIVAQDSSSASIDSSHYSPDKIPSLQIILENADLIPEGKSCKCKGVNLLWAPVDKDIIRVINSGPEFNEHCMLLLSKATVGDKFLLDKIKLDCGSEIQDASSHIIIVADNHNQNEPIARSASKDRFEYSQIVKFQEDDDTKMFRSDSASSHQIKNDIWKDHASFEVFIESKFWNNEFLLSKEDEMLKEKYTWADTLTYYDEDSYKETLRVDKKQSWTKTDNYRIEQTFVKQGSNVKTLPIKNIHPKTNPYDSETLESSYDFELRSRNTPVEPFDEFGASSAIAFYTTSTIKDKSLIKFLDLADLMEKSKKGTVKSFKSFNNKKALSLDQVEQIFSFTDTITYMANDIKKVVTVQNEIMPEEIKAVRLHQTWYWDRKLNFLRSRFDGITLLREFINAEGKYLGYENMIYYKFD